MGKCYLMPRVNEALCTIQSIRVQDTAQYFNIGLICSIIEFHIQYTVWYITILYMKKKEGREARIVIEMKEGERELRKKIDIENRNKVKEFQFSYFGLCTRNKHKEDKKSYS